MRDDSRNGSGGSFCRDPIWRALLSCRFSSALASVRILDAKQRSSNCGFQTCSERPTAVSWLCGPAAHQRDTPGRWAGRGHPCGWCGSWGGSRPGTPGSGRPPGRHRGLDERRSGGTEPTMQGVMANAPSTGCHRQPGGWSAAQRGSAARHTSRSSWAARWPRPAAQWTRGSAPQWR